MTLVHAIEGAKIISEMSGWGEAVSKLTRHPKFNSIVEYYESPLLAYGTNGIEDGGIDWIKNVERLYGPDAIITQVIEENESGRPEDFELVYSSKISVASFVESVANESHDLKLLMLPNDLWARLISRMDTSVDLRSTEDLYGGSISAQPSVDIKLLGQKIRELSNYKQVLGWDYSKLTLADTITSIPANSYVQIDLDDIVVSEIEDKFNLPKDANPLVPASLYTLKLDGVYNFDIRLNFAKNYYNIDDFDVMTGSIGRGYRIVGDVFQVYIQFNNDAPIALTFVDHTIYPGGPYPAGASTNEYTEYTYSASKALKKGDEIRIYGYTTFAFSHAGVFHCSELILYGSDNSEILTDFTNPTANSYDSHINIYGDTTFPDTVCPGFFQHDIFGAICDRITGRSNSFHSDYLGGTNTLYKVYGTDGAACGYVNARGLQIRGYSLVDKPFSQSLTNQWNGSNPILNLGMGYDLINGEEKVVIKKLEDFFDASSISIYLSDVKVISRAYDPIMLINQFECGYKKWQENNLSKIDDPQTKTTRASIFKTVGTLLSQLSDFLGASLLWEVTRRTAIVANTAFSFDNDTFIMASITDMDGTRPELDEGFSSVTNLLNEDTRYNKRITTARNFLRWRDFISSGLQVNLSSVWKFISGEGNYDMVSTMTSNGEEESFNGASLSEKQDIQVSGNPLFLPMLYTIEHYLTKDQYKTLQQNRHLAIGVSQSTVDHTKFFIQDLQYKRSTGEVKMTAWPKTFMDLKVVNNDTPENNYVFGDEFAHPPFS